MRASPEWAPDGKTIAFSSTARPAELTAAQKPAADKPRETDVRVITEAVYRANGVPGFGYVDRDRPTHIWTVPVPANASEKTTPAAVTTGEFAAANHRWSPDGTRLYFVSDRRREPYYYARDSDLYSIARDGGEPARVASIEGWIGAYALSPDGKRVAFVGTLVGNPERSYTQPDLVGGRARLRNAAQPHGRRTTSTSTAASAATSARRAVSSRADRSGPATGARYSSARANRATPTSSASTRRPERSTAVTTGNHDVMSYTADDAGQKLAIVRSTPTVLGDLHVLDAASTRGDEAADDVQRRAVRAAHYERSGRNVVHELRRQKDPGVDPQAADLRCGEEVSVHSRDSRRTARRLRQHVHA